MDPRTARPFVRTRLVAAATLIAASAIAAAEVVGSARGADPLLLRPAQGQELGGEPSRASDLRPPPDEARKALARGLEYLAAEQRSNQDGSFPRAGGASHVPVALAALGSLAFMASGSTPERGPWGREVARGIDFLLSKAEMTPSPHRGYVSMSSGDQFGMHAHGYATMALAQAYTVAPSSTRGQRIAEVLEAATDLIERSQTPEGGWFYRPDAGLDHENSVTVVQLQALRAARNCGMRVEPRVIDKAVDYIRRCQNEDGSFRYALGPEQKTSLALTAAGLATLQNAGRYEGPEVTRAVLSMWRELVEREQGGGRVDYPHYERLYVALALWTHPDRKLFERWAERERAQVVRDQRPDGSWPDAQFGACYATAMNCLFLAVEDELLPLFER